MIDLQLLDNGTSWLRKSYSIFDELIACGNQVAVFRKSELLQLEEMLKGLPTGQAPLTSPNKTLPQDNLVDHERREIIGAAGGPTVETCAADTSMPSPISASMFDEDGLGKSMTTAQIMEIVKSIDSMETGWTSQELLDHNSW